MCEEGVEAASEGGVVCVNVGGGGSASCLACSDGELVEVVEALDCGYLKTLPAPDDADAGRRGCAFLASLLPLEVVGAAVFK